MNTSTKPSTKDKAPFVLNKNRDKLQVRLHKDHLEGNVLIDSPHYNATEALQAAISEVDAFGLSALTKETGKSSSSWKSLTRQSVCAASSLAHGIHFQLPLNLMEEEGSQGNNIASSDVDTDAMSVDEETPESEGELLNSKGTKRSRPDDNDDDDQPPAKRPNTGCPVFRFWN